jgi:hypothetical protein
MITNPSSNVKPKTIYETPTIHIEDMNSGRPSSVGVWHRYI